MLAYKVMGANVQALAVQALCLDAASGLTATGTNQGTAYAVTTATAEFTTVAAGTGAVLSSSAVPSDSQLIYNGGSNPLSVYPPLGGSFNAQATNAAMLLQPATACLFVQISTTRWTGILSL